jgi:RPA family protein
MWVIETAKCTLDRIKALDSASPNSQRAKEYYDPDTKHYSSMVSQALKSLKETY